MIEGYKKIIKDKMGEKRYVHSVNVSNMAIKLAKKYSVDEEKAAIAGVLHDITKEMSDEFHLELFKENDTKLDEVEKRSKKLWHAISGSIYIKNELHIDDEDILNAVKYHTTARKGMSKLEKIIFIADFISEDRKYENSKIMRKLAFENIDETIIYGLKFTIEGLLYRNQLIAKDALEAYNDIIINQYKSKKELFR